MRPETKSGIGPRARRLLRLSGLLGIAVAVGIIAFGVEATLLVLTFLLFAGWIVVLLRAR